jgi:hypothetical protein
MTAERPVPPHSEGEPLLLTLDEVRNNAIEILLAEGEHVPTVVAEGKLNTLVLQISELGATHEERIQQMMIAGYTLSQHANIGPLQQTFFISEAWMSTNVDETAFRPPSQDPDRKEVLAIARLTMKEHKTEVLLFEMVRDTSGTLTEVRASPVVGKENDWGAESPLLDAFTRGFQGGASPSTRPN